MSRHLFVISDLHLGGGPGFQMITAEGRGRLSRFVRGIAAQHRPDQAMHLILNGDIVDFLAETPFAAFTPDDAAATRKLEQIFASTAEFWDALSALLRAGGELTLLIGNHDLELSLPGPRRRLLERLGPGRVDFLYDNQALPIGPVLIEHGNRYDGWNMVNHDQLRQVRSALSRRQTAPPFRVLPGSEMVVRLMNPLKEKYSFIDLLKPEDSAVPPFLAVLEPSLMSDLRQLFEFARLGAESRQKFADAEELARVLPVPTPAPAPASGGGFTDGVRSVFSYVARELHMHELAAALTREELTDSADTEETALTIASQAQAEESTSLTSGLGHAVDFAALWNAARGGDQHRRAMLFRLRKALLARAGDDAQAFRLDHESPAYLGPAREAARGGFSVIVYGHTHLVRRVRLTAAADGGAVYLNAGTWADLMRVPDAILRPDTPEEEALAQLGAFADDLSHNRLTSWRRHRPTFARIDLGDDLRLLSADVFLYSDSGKELGGGEKLPDGLLPL
jgi:UDP-2,3-diacylglucosamine pyrophosphatase LpxH